MPTISMESCAGPWAQSWKKVTGSITVQAGLGPAEARRGQQVPGAVDGLSAPCEVNVPWENAPVHCKDLPLIVVW